jgi:hypothetical protein
MSLQDESKREKCRKCGFAFKSPGKCRVPCKFLKHSGGCLKGKNCHFDHSVKDIRPYRQVCQRNIGVGSVCVSEELCPFLHPRFDDMVGKRIVFWGDPLFQEPKIEGTVVSIWKHSDQNGRSFNSYQVNIGRSDLIALVPQWDIFAVD